MSEIKRCPSRCEPNVRKETKECNDMFNTASHECLECGHESNEGKWVGAIELVDGTEKELVGIVKFDHESNTWLLDDIVKASGIDEDNINGITGEADCPICGSIMDYLKE